MAGRVAFRVVFKLNRYRMSSSSFCRKLTSTRARSGSSAGYALAEILATIVIMSVLITALLSGLFTLIVASGSHRKVIESGLEATTIAEAIERAPYVPCGTLADYRKVIDIPAPSAISGLTASLAGVRYVENGTASSANFVTSCTTRVVKGANPAVPDMAVDGGVQEITVEVLRARTGGTERVKFTKRDGRCGQYTRASLPGQTC